MSTDFDKYVQQETTYNEFTFTDNDGSTLVEVKGADATQATAFFTKGQFDSATQTVAQYVSTEVQYNSGTTTLFEAPADSMIFSISVDVGSASSGTAVITAIVLTQASVTSNITRDYGSVASQ